MPPHVNSTLSELETLTGDWEMKLSNASFLPDPTMEMKGHASFQWLERGAFLVLYMGDPATDAPDATWLISRDESADHYRVFYYDNRDVSRVYEMSFADDTWRMWRNSPGFSQRFSAKLSGDGRMISGFWEKSSDGNTWEHDFDVTYSRD